MPRQGTDEQFTGCGAAYGLVTGLQQQLGCTRREGYSAVLIT